MSNYGQATWTRGYGFVDSSKGDFHSLLLIAVPNESFPVAFHTVRDVDDIDGWQA